jgi:hypothetical protein
MTVHLSLSFFDSPANLYQEYPGNDIQAHLLSSEDFNMSVDYLSTQYVAVNLCTR